MDVLRKIEYSYERAFAMIILGQQLSQLRRPPMSAALADDGTCIGSGFGRLEPKIGLESGLHPEGSLRVAQVLRGQSWNSMGQVLALKAERGNGLVGYSELYC